jgi:hypothetical protein
MFNDFGLTLNPKQCTGTAEFEISDTKLPLEVFQEMPPTNTAGEWEQEHDRIPQWCILLLW